MKERIVMIFALALVLIGVVAAAGPTSSPNIQISQISQTPDPAEPGQYVELRFRVDNLGSPASDYVYQLDYGYPFSLDPGSVDKVSVGTVDSYQVATGEGAVLYWKLRIDPNAVPGSQNTVKIRYYPANGSDVVYTTQDFVVRIGSQQGLLIVKNATITPSDAKPGQKVHVTLSLENLGTSYVKNVRVNADVTGGSFSPYGSANGRLVTTILAGQTKDVGFDFFVSPDASLGVAQLPFSINYTSAQGTIYPLTAVVGIPIDESPSYLASLESTSVYVPGQKGDITVSVSNTGSSPLDYTVITLGPSKYYDVIGPTRSYLGNLKSDDFETGQFTVYVNKDAPKPLPLNLSITYRTAYGEERTDTASLSLPLYDETQARTFGLVSGGNRGSSIVVFLVIVAAIVAFIWWRRRRSKKARAKR